MMMVLSREAVKIMSGFSDDVAMAVTSPLVGGGRGSKVKRRGGKKCDEVGGERGGGREARRREKGRTASGRGGRRERARSAFAHGAEG